jgi:hypothetical protein
LFSPALTGVTAAGANYLSPYMPYQGSPYSQYGGGGSPNVASATGGSSQYNN